MNKKIFLVIFLIFLFPFLFFFFGVALIFSPIFLADLPLEISCSAKEQKCESYSIKFYQPFLYIFIGEKVLKKNPEKRKELSDKFEKLFTEPKQEFYVSDIKEISCKKLLYTTWGNYSANIYLKNKKNVLLGFYPYKDDCEKACKIVKSKLEKNGHVEKYSLIHKKEKTKDTNNILRTQRSID
ncbi:hypothetical protein IJD15_04230 [bacterium]|nr:hypothetical protein [bacterium]